MLCSLLPQAMSTIKNTKKTLVEHLLLKQESVKDKSLLERIRMDPTLSTKLYNKLIEADLCWHKVDDFYFSSCPPELHFHKKQKVIMHQGVQRTPGTHLGSYITFFHKNEQR